MKGSSFIYSLSTSFHQLYKPVEIILACTAIQSIAIFAGLTLGINAPLQRKLKALFLSVLPIYGLNILRNMFVVSAYYGQWFGSPLQSFDIAHGVIARIGVMISLIIIAYLVFIILPESLKLVEDFISYLRELFIKPV
jgi:archaeosortase A (PGF-CTERM-specific)